MMRDRHTVEIPARKSRSLGPGADVPPSGPLISDRLPERISVAKRSGLIAILQTYTQVSGTSRDIGSYSFII
jgi:hypothetical protein